MSVGWCVLKCSMECVLVCVCVCVCVGEGVMKVCFLGGGSGVGGPGAVDRGRLPALLLLCSGSRPQPVQEESPEGTEPMTSRTCSSRVSSGIISTP